MAEYPKEIKGERLYDMRMLDLYRIEANTEQYNRHQKRKRWLQNLGCGVIVLSVTTAVLGYAKESTPHDKWQAAALSILIGPAIAAGVALPLSYNEDEQAQKIYLDTRARVDRLGNVSMPTEML
jgi:hypothetical protein